MWPFRKRISLRDSGIFEGFTDFHSHILPGVDDGVQTMEESLAILREYESLGVQAVWLTPHIMEDIPNTTAHLKARFSELQAAYTGSVRLYLAAENMLDNLFLERLERNDVLPIGEGGDQMVAAADLQSHFGGGGHAHLLLHDHGEGPGGVAAEFPAGHLDPALPSHHRRTAVGQLLRLELLHAQQVGGNLGTQGGVNGVQNVQSDIAGGICPQDAQGELFHERYSCSYV